MKRIALVSVSILVNIITAWSRPASHANAETIDAVANRAAPSIYMVSIYDHNAGMWSTGTAYPIHSYPHVGTFWATDAHVVEKAITDASALLKSYLFAPWTGNRIRIRSILIITQDDTAVIETSYMRRVKTLSFSRVPVQEGDTVVHLGYGGQNGDSRSGPLYIVGSVDYFQDAPSGKWTVQDAIYSTDRGSHGDCGGPLLDESCRVVGMIDAFEINGPDGISIPEQTVVNDTSSMVVSILDQQLQG